MKDNNILLTEHAKMKMHERSISLAMVEQAILKPDLTKIDKFDSSIKHYIKNRKAIFKSSSSFREK